MSLLDWILVMLYAGVGAYCFVQLDTDDMSDEGKAGMFGFMLIAWPGWAIFCALMWLPLLIKRRWDRG